MEDIPGIQVDKMAVAAWNNGQGAGSSSSDDSSSKEISPEGRSDGTPMVIDEALVPIERHIVEQSEEVCELPEGYDSPDVLVPVMGQTFKTEVDAFNLFNIYALKTGFGIRLHKPRVNIAGKMTMREIVCCHQGKNGKTKKQSVRVGCDAVMRINRPGGEGLWTVTKLVTEHNHPMKKKLSVTKNYHSHNHIDEGSRIVVADMVDSGMRSTNMYGLLSGLHGGASMMPFTRRAMDRLAYAIKRDECSGDVQKTLDFFKELQSKSTNFFYSVQVDGACRVKNIFWSHAVSRINFDLFGGVMVFDTTYKTNSYDMPCAPFVGINNHFQSILFGCALLREETVESFVWLFETFKQCMKGKMPECVMTDNCHQMAVAINRVYPDASHRICKWHIMKKVKENMGNVYSARPTFKEDMHKVLTLSLTVDEFEGAWQELISKYELEDCVCLKQMWDIRERWAFPYFSNLFYAGMTTTQRSESVNAMLKRFIPRASSMIGFVRKYEAFFLDRLQVEGSEDFQTDNDKIEYKTRSPLERQAGKVYTRAVFNLFSEQIAESLQFNVEDTGREHFINVVRIGRQAANTWRRKEYEVYANIETMDFSCICKMFEHKGILCSHILRVFVQNGIPQIPEKYILDRWKKDAQEHIWNGMLHGHQDDVDAAVSRTYRHLMLHRRATQISKAANVHAHTYKMAMDGLDKLDEDIKKALEELNNGASPPKSSENQAEYSEPSELGEGGNEEAVDDDFENEALSEEEGREYEEGDEIQTPVRKRGRGRPKKSRNKSGAEIASTKKSKSTGSSTKKAASGIKVAKRYCGKCGQAGHYSSTCGGASTYVKKYQYKE